MAALAGALIPAASVAQGASPEAPPDSVIFWNRVVRVEAAGEARDVAFPRSGRNIVKPIDVLWVAAAATREIVAVAAKPIRETAAPGEVLGRAGSGWLRRPRALCVTEAGRYVLDEDGRLCVWRGQRADPDTLRLPGPARDVEMSPTGLLVVLGEDTVRVYTDPPAGPPLWTLPVPEALRPGVALAVSARGEVYVAGGGADALAVFDLDDQGRFQRVRGAARRALGIDRVGGLALTPMMIVPVDLREGWIAEDRFLLVSDRDGAAVVALDARTLAAIGRWDAAPEIGPAQPERLDVSNRGQIALTDARSGTAWALPARVLAALLAEAEIFWRSVVPSEEAAGP